MNSTFSVSVKIRVNPWLKSIATAILLSAALITHAFAPPTPALVKATPTPGSMVTGPFTFSTAPDGSLCQWMRYTPSGGGPWPIIVIVHGGAFSQGSMNNVAVQALDMQTAGYLALAINYRLGLGLITNQPATFDYGAGTRRTGVDGPTSNIHDELDDVRAAIVAARADSHCNGKVFLLGGSAGGTLCMMAALTGTVGTTKPDAVVCLSGSYDGSDVSGLRVPTPPAVAPFTEAWETHVNVTIETTPSAPSITSIQNASPVYQTIANIPHMLLICSANDPIQPQQLPDMVTTLTALGITFVDYPTTGNYQKNVCPGKKHSWDYWLDPAATGDSVTVKQEVIAWFNSQL